MSDAEIGGQACCILEICCGGATQIKALAKKIHEDLNLPKAKADEVAYWIITHYDLAPVGTLRDFKRAIAALAREYPPEPGY